MQSRSLSLVVAVLVLALSSSCASSGPASSPGTEDRQERSPLVKLEQVGGVMEMGVKPEGGIPMQYKLTIDNPFDYEVKLTSVEVQSVGDAGGYAMNRVRHTFSDTVAAKTTREINFRAWVNVLTEGEMRAVDHPVLLRGVAHFQGPACKIIRNFSARVNETVNTNRDR